jgi:hypothetical protein
VARSFTYGNVPTETPLIIKTSNATPNGLWANVYEYGVSLANNAPPTLDVSAAHVADLAVLGTLAGGFRLRPDRGMLLGEVHDCGDVRLSGATVEVDQPHEGPAFYFNEDESNPLPDRTRENAGLGTSGLSLFGALNLPPTDPTTNAAIPVRVSAVGFANGQNVLLGTHVVEVFPSAVTMVIVRGPRL